MSRVFTWPAALPPTLVGLFEAVAERSGGEWIPIDKLTSIAGEAGASDVAVVVLDAGVRSETSISDVIDGIQTVARLQGIVVVFVVGDSYLGTDDPDLAAPMCAAAAISAARSVAVRRGVTTRVNVVCIPGSFFGDVGAQRGPLAQQVECSDVVEATAFFLGEDASYLNGQVLFVDGGRHVFSSMSA